MFFSALFTLTAQDIHPDKVIENLAIQLEVYPQEKIHLHTDRDVYAAGEKIMFKAYLVDAHTHLYPTYSRYVYVELITPDDSVVNRVMVRPMDDLFYGHLPLSANIPEGNYTLRAYTRYLENQGDDWFFKKNIRIVSKGINPLVKSNEDDYDVSFFPEGGNLPEGVFCKVALKALNSDGSPVHLSGEIVDDAGVVITSVQTVYAGMGVFTFIPEAGKRYRLKCRTDNGREKQFELPQPHPRACTLNITSKNNRLFATVQKADSAPEKGHFLFVHCRGHALYFSEWNEANETIVFDENSLPAGVLQFVLFDEQMNPLSERLVFSKNYDNVTVDFRTDKPSYMIRDKVVSMLSFVDSDGNIPLTGHLSVAITDDRDIAVDESTTILSSLLLSSELKGYIANPAYYLQDNPVSDAALDLLMMTHGWRRYNIPEVVKGNPAYPQIPYQTG